MHELAALAFAGAVLSLGVSPVAAAGGPSEFDHERLARQALEKHIRPSYRRLLDAAQSLDAALSARCGGGASARAPVEQAFDAMVTAWGRAEHIGFGPVTVDQRLERIMFWPDRRGIAGRQVEKALKERSSDVLDPALLAKKSVGMQGLPALEMVLFGPESESTTDNENVQFRCGFAKAIAVNLKTMVQAIDAEWSSPDGFAASWLSPGPSNAHFLKPVETTIVLAKAFDLGLEKLRDQRIGGPLALNPQRRKIAPAFGRSGRSVRLIAANIGGLRDLYVEGGIERALVDAKSDNPAGTAALAKLVAQELATARQTAVEVIELKDPFARASAGRIIALGFPLKNARSTAASLLAAVTDLPLGFNASDGD